MRFEEHTRVSAYKLGHSFFNITNNDLKLILSFLLTGDHGRKTIDPDLLGEMVKIEQGSNLLDQIFNLIARYVRKVHSDKHIHNVIRNSAGRSFLDIVGPSEKAFIV
jgi:hypothetical protein